MAEVTYRDTENEWRDAAAPVAFGDRADWQLQIQEHRADPNRIRVHAQDAGGENGFTCEPLDGVYFMEADSGDFNRGRLPQGLLLTAQDLAKEARVERCGVSKGRRAQIDDLEVVAKASADVTSDAPGKHAARVRAERSVRDLSAGHTPS